MKTPIQEVYENFNLMSDADFKAWVLNTDLLKKEKDVMCDFADNYVDQVMGGMSKRAEQYYNETFNTEHKWKRYRLKTYAVTDYRPLVFNEKYPFWCSGYGENSNGEYAVIIAYLPKDEDLLKYWDDAFEVEFTEEESISFSSRFQKPEYFVES